MFFTGLRGFQKRCRDVPGGLRDFHGCFIGFQSRSRGFEVVLEALLGAQLGIKSFQGVPEACPRACPECSRGSKGAFHGISGSFRGVLWVCLGISKGFVGFP